MQPLSVHGFGIIHIFARPNIYKEAARPVQPAPRSHPRPPAIPLILHTYCLAPRYPHRFSAEYNLRYYFIQSLNGHIWTYRVRNLQVRDSDEPIDIIDKKPKILLNYPEISRF